MESKVLALVPALLGQEYVRWLREFNLDKVRVYSLAADVPFGQLAAEFNAIVVDTLFCGNPRDTAALVRRIRREFFDPILAVQHVYTNEGPFPLQVAGCNFMIEPDEGEIAKKFDRNGRILRSVCFTLDRVYEELERPHQKTP